MDRVVRGLEPQWDVAGEAGELEQGQQHGAGAAGWLGEFGNNEQRSKKAQGSQVRLHVTPVGARLGLFGTGELGWQGLQRFLWQH